MNKLLQKVAKLTLGLAMAAGVGVAVSAGRKDASTAHAATDASTYELVNSTSSLEAGKSYIITNGTSGTVKAIATTTNANNRKTTDVTVTNSKITRGSSVMSFTLGGSSGAWTFQCENYLGGNGYLASASSGKNNYLRVISDAYTATIAFSGNAVQIRVGPHTERTLIAYNANNGNPIFACYSSGQSAVYLWKEISVKQSTISFNQNSGEGGQSSSVTATKGSAMPTISAVPTRTGYTFDGYYDAQSGGKKYYNADKSSANTWDKDDATFTLYAHWIAKTYGITYYDQGGSPFSGSHASGYPTQHTYGTATTLKSATKGGHNFDGWFTNSACTGSAVTSLGATSYTAAISLYAKWTAAGTTYSITTTVTNGTYSGDTTITDNGGVASVTISPTGDYKLPTSVSVSGASHTYNAETGVISLSGATGNVTINAAMVALTEYSITVDETNGSHTGASTIKESRTASLTFEPDSGYGQPASVTVTGATYTWTRGTGVLSLSNPTGNVSVTYVASENELTSITLGTKKTAYLLGENFSMPVVTAHYSVASDKEVTTSATESGYDPYSIGNKSITISYTEGGITKTSSYSVTVSAKSVQTITTWEATTLSQLTADDVFVIVGNNGSNYAMTNDNGTTSAPGVAAVTVSNNKLSAAPAANLQWKISGNATDGYTFYPNGSTTTWLYCTATNNGVRVGTNANKTFTISDGGYLVNAGTSRYVGIYSSQDWRCYTSINSNIQNQTFSYFKKVETQVGTASLIRIVCDPLIDPETGYKGGDKFVGDTVYTTDFIVKKQLDTGNELTAITGFTINGGSEVVLTSTSNTITVSYTEGGIPKSTEVVVAATERAAELESVQLVEKGEVKKSGYIDFASATWNLDNIYVHYYWSDDDFDTEVTLASLVATDDATISPTKPTVGATSFTVSYEYLEVEITNNTITLTEAVRSDYVKSMSWGNTTAAHFKHFSGEQLTEQIVNTWHVKATYAGAGEGSRLYWGDYDLYIGSKQITYLPYTWLSEDDGQALSIHYGEDVDGNEFVKTNDTAVGNICATINAIDHDETSTGEQTITLDVANATFNPSGTSGTGSEATTTISGFTITTDKGYYDPGTSLRIYSGGLFEISSSYEMTAVAYTTAPSDKGGLSDDTFSATTDYSVTTTAQARIASITITYNGTVTTTTHYANDMNHFDAQKNVVAFAKFMNTTMNGTNVCSGTFANLESAWDDVADKYDELFGASTTLNATELAWAKNMLKYANAAWGSDAELACVEKAMKTYEHCTSKYELTPFMDGVRAAGAKQVAPLANIIGESSNTIAIIVIISMVSVTAIGGYFFLRKRKEI